MDAKQTEFDPIEAKALAMRWTWQTGRVAIGKYNERTGKTTLTCDGHVLTRGDINSAQFDTKQITP